ncbi:pentatricopeptide repeat-containing protein At5g67570, chloroplastic [Nymphaea colorata]|nr:pentatricopeptide repeat-containing protein At5g67570, chloroplastic [Nymphaea colorata]
MEATALLCSSCSSTTPQFQPNTEKLRRRLLRRGVTPTPKILHALSKKELQKFRRRSNKKEKQPAEASSVSVADAEESRFRDALEEYRMVMREVKGGEKDEKGGGLVRVSGKPWEGGIQLLRDSLEFGKEDVGERLKEEHLEELRGILAQRNRDSLSWLLDDDMGEAGGSEPTYRRRVGGNERIQWLVKRLSAMDLRKRDWKFSRLMIQSRLVFSEVHLLRIIQGLGKNGKWEQALSVVEWVYSNEEYKHYKSRYVYTKLLAILGKARRPVEALNIFKGMQEDYHIYPDMAAYHSISVTLGQAGLIKELLHVIDCMRKRPSKLLQKMHRKDWNRCLEPDVVVYNSVLNACATHKQWKGALWVLEKLKHNGLKPSSATYGLAMEVMLKAGKYELVHKFFGKMRKRGLAPNSHTYKVLVTAYWREGKIDDAVEAVLDMERRGVVGSASVYYELACCLCNKGRWRDAMVQIEKLKKDPSHRPLEIAFTGMIRSCMEGGHMQDCISMFDHIKSFVPPSIGIINIMLKVYGRSDMFAEAKGLFESIKMLPACSPASFDGSATVSPDSYSYSSILEASAAAQQWEYFEYVYKEMILSGFQLDQQKHALLLVEASRAGKWHLLEHAFDLLLEAEEIPCQLLFMEMICQNIARLDFERAVTLIKGMEHALLHVNDRQWIDLFRRNCVRIGKEKVQKLLSFFDHCNTMSDTPISSLLKALNSLSSVDDSTSVCNSASPVPSETSNSSLECHNDLVAVTLTSSTDEVGQDCSGEIIGLGSDSHKGGTWDISTRSNNVENADFDVPTDIITSYFNSNSGHVVTDLSVNDQYDLEAVNGSQLLHLPSHSILSAVSELPSASEILKSWKKAE